MSADEVLVLCIVGAYFAGVAVICWYAGQLLISLAEIAGDWIERKCKK